MRAEAIISHSSRFFEGVEWVALYDEIVLSIRSEAAKAHEKALTNFQKSCFENYGYEIIAYSH